MKMIAIAIFVFFLVPAIAPAQNSEQKQAETTIQWTITFSNTDFIFETIQGYDRISLIDGNYLNDLTKPMLPTKQIKLAIPPTLQITTIKIISIEEQKLPNLYNILPAQPPQTTNKPTTNKLLQPDKTIYNSNNVYPTTYIKLDGQTDLAGQNMAEITIYPLHYIPAEKQLTMISSITFVVQGINGYQCGDYLSTHISEEGREMYKTMVTDMVVNPEDVQLCSSTNPQPIGVGAGDYDYVIITSSTWASYFQPLADWKTKKGIPATVVTTTWIYNSGGYTGDNQNKIRMFVQDANTNWGTIFFLLGGDTGTIPAHSRTFSTVDSDPVPNDAYYGDFDWDYTTEVHVGRASVTGTGTSAGGIGNFINKILTYEKNPPLTDYAKKAALFGFDLDSSTPAEQCKSAIDSSYIPANWTMSNVYDSHTGSHKTNSITAVNAGQNLINHADHSSPTFMGIGSINHDTGWSTGDVDAFSNGNKQSILYSMGCDPAAYDSSNCIAEHFVRDTNGGGVAFIGNSRYGWYYQGDTNSLSMLYDKYFFRSIFQQNWNKLGMAFTDHKNDGPTSADVEKYIYTELTLLGDPEMPIWKENPTSITVTHPSTLPTGSSSFLVDTNTPTAIICLWKGTEVYMIGTANANGDYTFTPNPTTTGTLYVTVTKQNYLPYEGTASVTSPQFSLTTQVNGAGLVEKDPDQTTYTFGQTVQLTAYPVPGYWYFDHWEGNVANQYANPTTITMYQDETVTAYFLPVELTLTLDIIGEGTVQKNPDQETYHFDDIVELIAYPEQGWSFYAWSGDHSGTNNPTTITISGDMTITATFIPNPFVLNLANFPIYQAQTPYQQMCGPAVAQMALNYMWWNETENPTGPPVMFSDQQWLYTIGHANNTDQSIPYLDTQGLWKLLQTYEPLPYLTYGYNFNKYSNADQNIMLKQICTWLNYTIGTYGGYKQGHPMHVPSLVPAYGDYSNWMAVRGIHTDRYTYPLPSELTIYGFWVNDPLPTGIGANSYKTINEWTSTYYLPVTSTDVYNGKYVAICEPPIEPDNSELILMNSPERFTTYQQYILSFIQNKEPEIIPDILNKLTTTWIIQAAIEGVTDQLIPIDQDFAALFTKTKPGVPLYIENHIGQNYYAVPFIHNPIMDRIPRDKKQPMTSTDTTMIVILIDATTGHFKEATWTQNPMQYLPITEHDARIRAYQVFEEYGFEPENTKIYLDLVYRENSPYYPDWQVICNEFILYIKQDGTIEVY